MPRVQFERKSPLKGAAFVLVEWNRFLPEGSDEGNVSSIEIDRCLNDIHFVFVLRFNVISCRMCNSKRQTARNRKTNLIFAQSVYTSALLLQSNCEEICLNLIKKRIFFIVVLVGS